MEDPKLFTPKIIALTTLFLATCWIVIQGLLKTGEFVR